MKLYTPLLFYNNRLNPLFSMLELEWLEMMADTFGITKGFVRKYFR